MTPFGRQLPVQSRLWRTYHRIFGEPSYRSQLFWTYLIRLIGGDFVATWLDAGCGGGDFLVELAKTYPHASFTGIDRDPQAIAGARELSRAAHVGNVVWVKSSLDEVDVHDFDMVSALGFMEFADDPRGTIKQLADHARDRGKIVFTAPNRKRGGTTEAQVATARFDSDDVESWMRSAGIPNPQIIEIAKGLSFKAYRVSQRLQRFPFAAAAFHVLSGSLVMLDPKFNGFGELLLCAGIVQRQR